MRFYVLLITTFFLTACGTSDVPNNSTNTKPANTNIAATNANNPLATTKTPEVSTINNAPTLAPVVQNYFAALQKKDEAAAKKYLSQSAIAYWQAEMKTDKSSSMLPLLEDDGFPVEEKREVRNEKIQGETGVAEVKGGSLANWTPIAFARENGEWKFASPKDSIALQNIPKTSTASNTAK